MGVILYELIIGCVPFFGETPEELFAHTVNDDIEWPEEDDFPVQPEAKDIITALLAQVDKSFENTFLKVVGTFKLFIVSKIIKLFLS